MENVVQKIQEFLSKSAENVISVTQGTVRLSKNELPKYAFSLSDIERLYGSVQGLIQQLPEKGFTSDVKVDLKKIYGKGADSSQRIFQTLTINFKSKNTENQTVMNNITTPQPTSVPQNPFGLGTPQQLLQLGYTMIPQTDVISAKVREERYDDIKRERDQLLEDKKDLKSEIRTLKEQNASLKLDLSIAEKKHELNLKEELLNKKSWVESPAMEKFGEALGVIAPVVVQKMMNAPVPAGLGNPTLSEIKQHFIAYISSPNVTDEQIEFLFNQLNNENE